MQPMFRSDDIVILEQKIDGLRKRIARRGLSLEAFADLHIDLAHAERALASLRKTLTVQRIPVR